MMRTVAVVIVVLGLGTPGVLLAREPVAATQASQLDAGRAAVQSRNARTEIALGGPAVVVQSGLEERMDSTDGVRLNVREGVSVLAHGVVLRTAVAEGGYPYARPRELRLHAAVWEVETAGPGACAERPADGRYSSKDGTLQHNGKAVEGGRVAWAWGALSVDAQGQVQLLVRPVGNVAATCGG